jgi:hypothetical protein
MCESNVKTEVGHLVGMNMCTGNEGDPQLIVFETGNAGPFWITVQESELNRYDCIFSLLAAVL